MSNPPTPRFGVMLVNLGTPSEPTATGVRRYLAQFLWDRRVIRIPRLLWWIILHGIVLRLRPGKVAKLYQGIWTEQGSPLLVISRRQQAEIRSRLQERLGEAIPVELAMTYGEPSLREAGLALAKTGTRRLLILPLYPQYSSTTTAAVFDGLAKALQPCPDIPELRFIRDYWHREDYLDALTQSIQDYWTENGTPNKLLFSFHGIPKFYEDDGDPYPGECRATAAEVVKRLGLEDDQWAISFQSRFGKAEWVKPYTDVTLADWGQDPAISRVDVICPAFAADCLETLEEIQEENKAVFIEAGGKNFHYIPCLNDRPDHLDMLTNLIQDNTEGWQRNE